VAVFITFLSVMNGFARERKTRVLGMIPQATLCITYSPVHTVDYYSYIADQLIEAGAPEICLKDMAGIGRPVSLGKIVAGIKKIKNIPNQKACQRFVLASLLVGLRWSA